MGGPTRSTPPHQGLVKRDLWKTKLSAILATSSTESELISVTHCASAVAFLRTLAEELGFHQVSPTIIYEDNNDCLALGNSGHFKDRSRHSVLHVSNHIDTVPIP